MSITQSFINFRTCGVSPQVPKDKEELAALQERLRKRFPVDTYNKVRGELDPNRILSNAVLEKLFPWKETARVSC